MKIIIEIPKRVYEHAKETTEDSIDETTAMRAIAKGTPITTYDELMELLKEIQDDCRERFSCEGCKFCSIEGCALQHIPDQWKIELIYTFPKLELNFDLRQPITPEVIEEFYKELEEGSGDNGEQ